MKKLFPLLLCLTLVAVMLVGCTPTPGNDSSGTNSDVQGENSSPTTTSVDMNIAALKGPTAMGMVKFMDDADSGMLTDHRYHFSIAASVDEVTPKLVQGELDLVAIPANLASVLYNNTKGGIQVLAINTLGVLYIVENGDTIQSVEDLRGKTIYASGKGTTPEYALH